MKIASGTIEEVLKASEEMRQNGAEEAGNFNLDLGSYEANVLTEKIGRKSQAVAFLFPYNRTVEGKNVQKFFKGVYFSGTHTESGRAYNKISVGMTDEEMREFSEPASLGKTYTIIVSDYPKSNGTRGQIAKIDKV